jgi:hypothetical protein
MISSGFALARQHVGIGHARHGQVGEGFAPGVAGGGHAHQAGVHGILHVATQDAVLDEHGALGRGALVVHVEGTAPVGQGAVVHHGDAVGGHPLADAAGKGGGALAVEVALQAVADGFVQQDAGPAGAQHHGHGAGGGGGATLFPAAVLFDDDLQGDAHQGPHVGGATAVQAGDEHHLVFAGQAGDDLGDPAVLLAGVVLQPVQQADLVGFGEGGQGIDGGIQGATLRAARHPRDGRLAGGGDGAHGVGGFPDGRQADVVGIGEGGLVPHHGAHAHALVDVEAAGFHLPLLQAPGFGAGVLEIEIGVVHPVGGELAEDAIELGGIHLVGGEEGGFGGGEGWGCGH